MWQEGGEAPFGDISDPNGDEIQKLSVIQTLPSLLAGDPQTCIQRLMPKMQQTLPTASTEFHVAASSTFKTILEQRLVSHSTFTETFLQSILNSLDSRDQIVAHAWLDTLLDVIELLPTDVIRLDILPTAVNKGQISQTVNSRIICCKLLGKICTRFDSQLIKKDILPTVHSLCQDVNNDVRACICLQLRYVAEGLGPESVKSALLPSIVELASDEASNVRHASVQTIVYLLPHLQPDVIKSTISPLIKKSCDIALISNDMVMCVIAQEFGKLSIGLEKCLAPAEKTWLIKYFQQLSQIGIPSIKKDNTKQEFPSSSSNPLVNERYVECRQLCAFNIPAMFLFASSSVDDIDILLPVFADLAGDPFYMVRRTIASGIHEVARILGPKNTIIKNDFIKLLKDDSEEVLQGLIPHVSRTLELFVQSRAIGTEIIDTTVMELGRALLKCEGEIFNTNNWRLSASIFEQLEILPKCFPSDYIYTYFVPVAMNRALNARPMPVRLAAGRTFLVFIRYNLKPMQRTELRNRIYTEFARGKSSYVRMIFIRMMIEAMDIYSSIYFKEYFFTTVLSLTEDPIANIRLKVVTLLPILKSYLRLPSDKKLLSAFESNVRNLMNNEKDRDVIFALTSVVRELDNIDVRHEGQMSSGKLIKQDNDDLRKYEEEKKLAATTPGKSLPPGQVTTMKKILNTSKSTISSAAQKAKQVGVSMTITDSTFKASRQTAGVSRNFDLSKTRHDILSDFSTSSDNLTSSWARLTSNSMLLTHLWEKIDHQNTNISVNSTNNIEGSIDGYTTITDQHCDCYNSSNFVYPTPISSSCNLKYKGHSIANCSCCNTDPECSKSRDDIIHKQNYFDTSLLTSPLRLTRMKNDRPEYFNNYFMPRNTFDVSKSPNIAALRSLTNSAQYNSCWAFSSMPEIPVTLLDDEFFVDTGVRMPAQLSTSQSTSKIPNLQDIIYRNTRIGNVNKLRRSSMNYDKRKSKEYYTTHENCMKPRASSFDQTKNSNRLPINYDDTKRYPVSSRGKLRISFDSSMSHGKLIDDKIKQSTTIINLDKTRISQSRSAIDKTKRHSTSYSIKSHELKDNKDKFKRHSLEVTDYNPIDRSSCSNGSIGVSGGGGGSSSNNRLKRNFTLDVNHNQGMSKIPLRNSVASGSRTAPVTRASSPIRLGPQLNFDRHHDDDDDDNDDNNDGSGGGGGGGDDRNNDYCTDRRLNRFSSSDEEVDKLCIRFTYFDPLYVKDENPRKSMSKLPVWVPRKKT